MKMISSKITDEKIVVLDKCDSSEIGDKLSSSLSKYHITMKLKLYKILWNTLSENKKLVDRHDDTENMARFCSEETTIVGKVN